MSCATETSLEALLQMTASGLDADEDDEFISFHLNFIIKTFLSAMQIFQAKEHLVRLCLKCLINLTANQNRCHLLHKFDSASLNVLVSHLNSLMLTETSSNEKETELSNCQLAASLICNLTREDAKFVTMFVASVNIDKLVTFIVQSNNKQSWDKLPQVLLNLSQEESIRLKLCDPQSGLIQQLTPFTNVNFSLDRRTAIAGLIRNCCFDDDSHKFLLSESVNLVSALIIPLCGAADVIDDEDRSALPQSAQKYPGNEATIREPDLNIRICHCQTLLQLCSTAECRSLIKSYCVYAVLRELHKWETDSSGLLAIEQVVDVLIGDDPPEELSHLRNVDVPDEMAKKIQESNDQFLID